VAFRSPIRRRRDGSYTVDLGPNERQLLVSMCDQMRDLLTSGDPSLVRLFPAPYGDDTERNEGYAALVVPELTERLHELKMPVLGFWGMDERMMPESGILKLAKNIPDIRLVLVSNCGHWVMVEHEAMFNRTTHDFLVNT
jgi:pimeloyl-ACP methyl ester carboxylesterase